MRTEIRRAMKGIIQRHPCSERKVRKDVVCQREVAPEGWDLYAERRPVRANINATLLRFEDFLKLAHREEESFYS